MQTLHTHAVQAWWAMGTLAGSQQASRHEPPCASNAELCGTTAYTGIVFITTWCVDKGTHTTLAVIRINMGGINMGR
jgi:hypothetical protein